MHSFLSTLIFSYIVIESEKSTCNIERKSAIYCVLQKRFKFLQSNSSGKWTEGVSNFKVGATTGSVHIENVLLSCGIPTKLFLFK